MGDSGVAAPVAMAASQLVERGWTILPEPLPSAFVAELAAAFAPLIEGYVAAADPNRGARRHQMYVPFEAPFDDPALWADPTVLAVLDRVLGPDAECTYYGSDTPYPGAEHQPVHQDGGPLFAGWDVRPPPYSIALNVPLVDVGEDDGPLEWFEGVDEPPADGVPLRFTAPAGTCLLRDTRLWHRGSPNTGAGPRPMLALLYTRPWYRFPLDRPAMSRRTYDQLPEPGRRVFRGADITPRRVASGDRNRFPGPARPLA